MALGSVLAEADCIGLRIVLNVLEHNDVVRTGRHRRAGHDLYRVTRRKLDPGQLDSVPGTNLASHGQGQAGAQVGGIAGIAIAGGPVKWGLVAIGENRSAEHSPESVCQTQNLSFARISKTKRSCVFADQNCSVGEAQDGGNCICRHTLILKGIGLLPELKCGRARALWIVSRRPRAEACARERVIVNYFLAL
jgi:hypothetical protein